jgi:pimeloyl-ACP methyl ester carboxylesterase
MALAALSMPNVEALVLVAPAILSGDACSDRLWRKFARCFTRLAVSALEKCVVICYPVILELLRTIVYNVAFWKWGVGKSWFDEAKVPNRLLTQYQWPSLVRDWDMGMAHFLRTHLRWAVLALSTHVCWSVEVPTCEGQTLVQKLNATELPILIVHGSEDILVPARNSRRLHQQLQNSTFVELPQCGHTPHEETPDQFVQIVGNFVVAQARKKVGDELQ